MTMFRIRSPLAVTALVVASLGLGACSSNSNDGNSSQGQSLTPDQFGAKYKLQDNELSGWTQKPVSDELPVPCAVYTAADINDRIDGDAPIYTNGGMKSAQYQEMAGTTPEGAECRVIVMDFGTDAKAKAMFDSLVKSHSADVSIPQYDATVAKGASAIGALTTYAHIQATFFQLEFIGFGSDTTGLQQTTQKFLDVLKAK